MLKIGHCTARKPVAYSNFTTRLYQGISDLPGNIINVCILSKKISALVEKALVSRNYNGISSTSKKPYSRVGKEYRKLISVKLTYIHF